VSCGEIEHVAALGQIARQPFYLRLERRAFAMWRASRSRPCYELHFVFFRAEHAAGASADRKRRTL